ARWVSFGALVGRRQTEKTGQGHGHGEDGKTKVRGALPFGSGLLSVPLPVPVPDFFPSSPARLFSLCVFFCLPVPSSRPTSPRSTRSRTRARNWPGCLPSLDRRRRVPAGS